MTIEQKIARDLHKEGLFEDLVISVFGENRDPFEHIDDLDGSLRDAASCKVCGPILSSSLLHVELVKALNYNLISASEFDNLFLIINSNNNSDIDLARELINNLRTKRLRNANERASRKIKSIS